MDSEDNSAWNSAGSSRILGMKAWQVGLLGGMGLLDCLVLAAGVVIIFSSTSSSSTGQVAQAIPTSEPTLPAAAVPVPTVDASTLTPEPSATLNYLFPTYTPIGIYTADSPTPTASATSSMEGWVKYSVREVELWMPGSFAAGNPRTDAKAIVASLKEKGANYNFDNIEKDLKASTKNYVFWGIDSIQGNPAIVTNVAILYEYPNPGETMADYATRFIAKMSGDYMLIEQNSIPSTLYEIDQILMETKTTSGIPMRVAIFAIRDQNIVWDVVCITAADEMDDRLPAFELMVDTLRVLAAP
jgi:hypothetical protein